MPESQINSARISEPRTFRWLLLAIAVMFVVYAAAWRSAPIMFPDSPAYMRFAREIQSGAWTHPQMRTPGYPIFLILTGSTERPEKLLFYATLALHMGTIVLLLSV